MHLTIRNLKKSFHSNVVLDDINLDIKQGEVTVIMGRSGCGKSTLLRCMNGLEQIDAGEIYLHDTLITKRGSNDAHWVDIRKRIGMVSQSYDLFPHMNVLKNMILGPMKVEKRSKKEAVQDAVRLLERVGLSDKITAYPRELSGGQKQRVAICRALCMHPEIILFDEVTAALDPAMVREVLDVIRSLQNQGLTLIVVTHEMEFAEKVADQIVFMDNGKIVEISTPRQFFYSPQTVEARRFLNLPIDDAILK
ncbi:polar amino acid transport system ATP-binding protein [Paenibacillus cellulosilyticus]|uniref:Polar amino acid transport system ATP-binding protein n=1 Tax=Paenibacillus cellulosilyticus TaxID=375489 RepID=A0A2V2YVN1_9BACL|nr:amino acid ABC transporter ATP-binding protein [Paenibacillus cellulosilyticus]PWW03275.1 polar amino acid transport system ATP-binding protein [Paenibacillus cellulosilyticus]QKS43753.1 amino acid ABC transporter ATP-binding protein [Paenibacillus cellulosilyticus]